VSAYIIVNVDVHDPTRYEEYKALAGPTVDAYGGKYIVRGGAAEALEGDWEPKRVVVVEFPDMARAKAWWSSGAYAPGKALRQEIATSQMIVVEGA
jgi:uncharacterized protein (DUF1330 family)